MDLRVAAIIAGLVAAAATVAPALAKDAAAQNPPVKNTHVAALPNAAAPAAEPTRKLPHRRSGKAIAKRRGRQAAALATADGVPLAAPPSFSAPAVGWRLIEDPATGARLGLPEKLVPHGSASRTGSRWTSAQGQIQVETFRLTEAALPALFEQEKKASRRQIAASELKTDSFVITGTQGLKNFLVRAQARGSEVRGITILYDQATEGTMDRVAAAMANAFTGFPDPNAAPPPGTKRAVEYGSAVVVTSDGDLIASAHVTDQCQAITVPPLGHAVRVAVDDANDLALIRLYGARHLVAAPLGGGGDETGELTLVGVADPLAQAGAAAAGATTTTARVTAQGIEPAPKLGFSGAAAVDARGSLAGMVALKPAVVAGAGAGGEAATLVPVEAIRAFLQAHGVKGVTGIEDITSSTPAVAPIERAAMERSVVRVICVRK